MSYSTSYIFTSTTSPTLLPTFLHLPPLISLFLILFTPPSPDMGCDLNLFCETWPVAINSCLGQCTVLQARFTSFVYFRLTYGPKYINLVLVFCYCSRKYYRVVFINFCMVFQSFYCCFVLQFFAFLPRQIENSSHILPGEVIVFWLVDAESFTSVVSRFKMIVTTFFMYWD